MEGSDLTVVDLNTKDFLRAMGNCIQYGLPCLLQVRLWVYGCVDKNTIEISQVLSTAVCLAHG